MTITDKTADVLLFTPGRAPCVAPLAIVLHGYSSGIEMLDLEMERCPRPRPRQSTGCHTSFHYGVDGCNIHQYVALANTAWGFGVTPPTCPAPICPPDECASCTGLTVEQYNPDIDGNDPVLPAFVAGTDGTANSCVIHVAVTGQSGFSALDAYGECCRWMEKSYQCFVRSLAQIFIASGLVPSQTTLLVHCQELLCIDIDQLVIDILVVINTPPAPPPPCNCQAVSVTPAAVCTALATFDDSLVAATVALGPDCLFHPITDVNVVGLDTTTVDITVVEGPVGTFTISADTIVDTDFLCDQLSALTEVGAAVGDVRVVGVTVGEVTGCGLFTVPVQNIQAADTTTIDTTVVEGPATIFTVSSAIVNAPATCAATSLQSANHVNFNSGHWVLSSRPDVDAGAPVWRKLGAGYVGGGDTGAGAIDVNNTATSGVRYRSVTGNQTINVPTNDCSLTELYIKNVSAAPITVTGVGTTIDGVAAITIDGTIPAGYPFGNNGGESVHLVWNPGRAEWQVF